MKSLTEICTAQAEVAHCQALTSSSPHDRRQGLEVVGVRGAFGNHRRLALGKAATPRQRVLATLVTLATLVLVLLTAVDCGSSTTDGITPRSSDGASAQALEQSFTQVVHRTLPSIVEIVSPTGLGSGVIFDDKGNVVTNAHVVGKSASFEVRPSTGTRTYPATLVASYPPDDIAVIRIQDAPPLKPAKFGHSSTLEVGDIVLAMGNPLGLDATVTNGLVSALGRTVQEPPSGDQPGAVLRQVIQTSAPINPGNSGGALVNCSGALVGIPTAGASTGETGGSIGLGFAIPVNSALTIAEEIISTGSVTHSFIGVQAQPLAASATGQGGQAAGLWVVSVVAGGPAASAGLREGDIIRSIDGSPATSTDQLMALSLTKRPGDRVELKYERDGRQSTATITLGSRSSGS